MAVIDSTNLIVGRLATQVSKRALLGEKIDIVNCEKAILTGRKESILKKYRERRDRGNPLKGPFISFMPDRFVRRIIRGMLPYKQEKGRLAFERVMCYIGIPEKLKDKKKETIKEADVTNSKNTKFIDVDTLTKLIRK